MAREVAEANTDEPAALDPSNAWTAHIAAMGLLDQQAPEREAYLWPDNVRAWSCWQGVQTQWRVGMGGATGLDYAGVRAFLDEQDLQRDERREVFAGIQACERATLEVWAEQRKRQDQQGPKAAPPIPGR